MKNKLIDPQFVCQNCEDSGINGRYLHMGMMEATPCSHCRYGALIKSDYKAMLNEANKEFTKHRREMRAYFAKSKKKDFKECP